MGIENPEALSGYLNKVEESVQETEHSETPAFDETEEVLSMLDRETHDGPGDLDNLPESDFESFATDNVEKDN